MWASRCGGLSRAAALALSLCLAACHDGYPRKDLVSGALLTRAEHVAQLNAMGEEAASKVRQHVSLMGDCLLRFTSARDNVKRASLDVPLLELDLSMRSYGDKQIVTIAVPDDAGKRVSRTVFASHLWHHAIAFRSHLLQLQRLCAKRHARKTLSNK